MAVRSREFVGIAEGIRSHELSTKGLIENLNIEISELSDEVSSVSHEISHLEAEIAAAYEDTDEDGEPNYGLIAALEGKKELKEARLMRKEQELHSTEKELDAKKAELKAVEEEKAQTLFEIQERARKTSANIDSVSNAYGAYAAAAARLQSSLQSSFSSLSQAAGILGGSVSGGGSGTASGGGYSAPRKAGGVSGSINTESGSLAAFTSGYSDGRSFSSSASRFSTNQSQLVTPATIGCYRSGKGTFQAKTSQNFVSGQNANEYTSGSFMDHVSAKTSPQNVNTYTSSQESLTMEKNFGTSEVPEETIRSEGNRKHTFADWINPENYQNGQYIGAGQEWGYKPYGKDSVEYESGILTPEQQKLNRYMQEHNYGKSDFSVYSKDREWQELYKAAYPDSGLLASMRGTPLARQQLMEYMYDHNYGKEDFAKFSGDEEWQRLYQMAYPDSDVISALKGSELAKQHLRDYMHKHHYSQEDYEKYSKDPEWQRLHKAAYPDIFENKGRTVSEKNMKMIGSGIRNRAHGFFEHFIKNNKDNLTEKPPTVKAVNQIIADIYNNASTGSTASLKEQFAELKEIPVNQLTKENLDKIVNIAVSNLKDKYQSIIPEKRFKGLAKKISFIDGEQVKLETKVKDPSIIGGYYDTKKRYIRINMDGNATVGDIIATIDHESMHFLSRKGKYTGVLKRDILYRNVGMNEGITEMLSIRNMQSVNPNYVSNAYTDEVDIVKRLESICGKEVLLDAYVKNDLSQVENDFNKAVGDSKAFKNFCNDLDTLWAYNERISAGEAAYANRDAVKVRLINQLQKYEKGKSGLAKNGSGKNTHEQRVSQQKKKETFSEQQYFKLRREKKTTENIVLEEKEHKSERSRHRDFVSTISSGMSLEKQKADADARNAKKKITASNASDDIYKEEKEHSLYE